LGTWPFDVGFSGPSCLSSFSFTAFGFFFFSFARIEDSRSGNGGISSKTVALKYKITSSQKWLYSSDFDMYSSENIQTFNDVTEWMLVCTGMNKLWMNNVFVVFIFYFLFIFLFFSFVQSFIHSLTHLLTHSLNQSLNQAFNDVFVVFIFCSLAHSLIYLFIHSFIHSLTRSLAH